MIDIKHYVEVLKHHEANQTSTNDRNLYWQQYNQHNSDVKSSKTSKQQLTDD